MGYAELRDEREECFVVSPIGLDGSETRQRADNVLNYVISPAAAPLGLKARRADDIDAPGSITSQIIQRLLSAKAAVVDLTDRNPNVYYELAVRDSFRLPVVLIAEVGTTLASDILLQRTIFFNTLDLASANNAIPRITAALEAAIETPGAASPVLVAAHLETLSAGDSAQQAIADLATQVQHLRHEIAERTPEPISKSSPNDLIETLGLPAVPYIRLKRAGISTLEELAQMSVIDILAIVRDKEQTFEVLALLRLRSGSPFSRNERDSIERLLRETRLDDMEA